MFTSVSSCNPCPAKQSRSSYYIRHFNQWRSQDYCKARAKKFATHFIEVYIRNCKQIIKKSKEIAQFIGVYIKNS